MEEIARAGLRAPARVVDVELTDATSTPVDLDGCRTLWCLYRSSGVPQAIRFFDVEARVATTTQELREDHLRRSAPVLRVPRREPEGGSWTVVICTRDRPEGLRATLESLTGQTDDAFDVLVVDNAPTRPARDVVNAFAGRLACRYVCEAAPGLSRARNRALAEVTGDVVAWLDDDETADPGWLAWLKQGLAHESAPDAVCGLMLPAELVTAAQARFEQYGGFNKGRGTAPEVLSVAAGTVAPLYPLPGFGAGGNMAFRVEALRRVGGFDPLLGAGTRTHGGEETQALAALLRSGSAVLHWPPALTWHYHRRSDEALERQMFGYSAGLSAFYLSMLRRDPRSLGAVLRTVPRGVADLRSGGSDRTGDLPDDFPPALLQASRRGLLQGAPLYLRELVSARGRSASRPC